MPKNKVPFHDIEQETILLPMVIADSVVREASCYLQEKHGIELPMGVLSDVLYKRCLAHYNANPEFRVKCKRNQTWARDWHYTFMRHWLASELYKTNPGALEKLPYGFSNGEAIRVGTP